MSEEVHPFLREVVFFIALSWLLGVYNVKFQKKRFSEAEEIASRSMGTRRQYSRQTYMEGISYIFMANIHDKFFCTAVFGSARG